MPLLNRFAVAGAASGLLLASLLCQGQAPVAAPPQLTAGEMETFLRSAKIVKTRSLSKGVTQSLRVTLSDGRLTHDAHVQTIDERRNEFRSPWGVELNFRDSWKYNIAAYRLARMLGLGEMVPMSVFRQVRGNAASITWWVDDVLMEEGERIKKKIQAPDVEDWNRQMCVVRIFDQLICNVDRNLQNLLITKDWKIKMIDHTRAFRLMTQARTPKNVTRCDRKLLEAMGNLNEADLHRELGEYLTAAEIRGLLGRRNHIVRILDGERAKKGDNAVLYDLTSP